MHRFTVKATQLIGKNVLLLTLQPRGGRDKLRFYAGQYAAIGYKFHGRPSLMRCFSIVSSPNRPDELQFAMRISGNFTNTMTQLEVGDEVFVRGPFGNFVVDERYDKNIVLLAGGIGVTPFISMIRYAAETHSRLPITLLVSYRSQDDIPFFEELIDLERQNPYFKAIFFVTNGGIDNLKHARVLSGRIDEQHLQKLTSGKFNNFTYFVCGPKSFNKSMQELLLSQQTDPERIISEEFTPSSQISAISTEPRFSITRWTYGLTGAALVLGIIFIMGLDLDRTLPKLLRAQDAQAAAINQTQTTSSTSNNVAPSSTTSSNTANNSSSSSSNQSATTPSQTYYYQPPVTSVS